jgi:hypothetical protein
MTKDERMALINEAKELGLKSVTIEGITYEFNTHIMAKVDEVPDVEPTDIVAPEAFLDQLTDEEVLFWSVSEYDDIQDRKNKMAEAAKQQG